MDRREFLSSSASGLLASAWITAEAATNEAARYIWYDSEGLGRNLYGLFRRSFEISGRVRSAEFHLFADTRYQLFVNGEFVEFGPVRFDPRFPLFDTHDLARRLHPGMNVIAVQVNYFGMHTFQSMPARAGMIGWGSVVLESGQPIPLATGSGLWRAVRSGAHARYASALSFALNAADLFDQAGEEPGWKEAAFDDRQWGVEVALARQDAWGPLATRSIPFMSGDAVPMLTAPSVRPLLKPQEWHSFSVPAPHVFEDNRAQYPEWLYFASWINSPRDQTVPVSVRYGEHCLNGRPAPKPITSATQPLRANQRWELHKGWNRLFGKVKTYHDRFDQYFAVPPEAGLVFAAEKDLNCPFAFQHSRTLLGPDKALDDIAEWAEVRRDDPAQSPCVETSWDQYGDSIEVFTPQSLQGQLFRLEDYPHGFALLVDLDVMHLCFPRIRMEGVRGATIDVTYGERLAADGTHIALFSWYPLGDRVLASRDSIDWFPSQPRGMRYLAITVRNASRDVVLVSLALRAANYPVQPKGRFRCSDACLNNVWEMCRRTQAANMEDAYDDCAGRERGMYGRDTVIQYHNNLALYGDHALFERCLQLFGQSPDTTGRFRIIYPNTGQYTYNDFALNVVEGYRSYYENTGDTRRIRGDWDAIVNNLRFFDRLSDEREDLLLAAREVLGGFGGDPGTAEGRIDPKGVNCFYSCAYLVALRSALVLGQAIGRIEDAHRMERRIETLDRMIPAVFWNPDKSCFSDNLERSVHSVHSNLFAVRAGVVTRDRLPAIQEHVRRELRSLFVNGYDASDGFLVSSSFAFYILDGLYQAGLADIAENLIRQGWGLFLAKGLRTCPEFFSLEQSLCHAWSASPVYYLSKYLLGVHYPDAPDLNRVEIRVQAHSVTAAEGAWPHPRGLIEVKWHMENARRVFDSVRAPGGVRVDVIT
ncbi:MAG: hypothetical protein WBL61_12655 [Bryobacteraceae bacterium]